MKTVKIVKKVLFCVVAALLCGVLLACCSTDRTVKYSRPLAKAVKSEFPFVDSLKVIQPTKPMILGHKICIFKDDWTKEEAESVYRYVIRLWLENHKDTALSEDGILSVVIYFSSTDYDCRTRMSLKATSDSEFLLWKGEYYPDLTSYAHEVFEYDAGGALSEAQE